MGCDNRLIIQSEHDYEFVQLSKHSEEQEEGTC